MGLLAANPEVGNAIPDSAGCRKVRGTREGSGMRSGTRVIDFTRFGYGVSWLLVIDAKGKTDIIPAHLLKATKKKVIEKE